MSREDEMRAAELLDEYLHGITRGKGPSVSELISRCPLGERDRLRLACSGLEYALKHYCHANVDDALLLSSFQRVQETKRKRQILAHMRLQSQSHPVVPPNDPVGYLKTILPMPHIGYKAGSRRPQFSQWNRGGNGSPRSSRQEERLTKKLMEARVGVQAEALLERCLIDAPAVSVAAIADTLSLYVQEAVLDGLDGCLLTDGDVGGILLNRAMTSARRKRFTLAHEIGHYMLHRHLRASFEDTLGVWGSSLRDEAEEEADTFASLLLMPSSLLPKNFGSEKPTFAIADSLVSTFDVSHAASLRRIVRASHWRCALVVVKDNVIKWYEPSAELDGHVRVGSSPERTTAAFSLKDAAPKEAGLADLPVLAWIDGTVAEENVVLREESRRLRDGYVYTLLTILD